VEAKVPIDELLLLNDTNDACNIHRYNEVWGINVAVYVGAAAEGGIFCTQTRTGKEYGRNYSSLVFIANGKGGVQVVRSRYLLSVNNHMTSARRSLCKNYVFLY